MNWTMDFNLLLAFFILDYYKKQDDIDKKTNEQFKKKLGIDMEALDDLADEDDIEAEIVKEHPLFDPECLSINIVHI